MRSRALLVTLVLLTGAMAGCAGGEEIDPSEGDGAEAEPTSEDASGQDASDEEGSSEQESPEEEEESSEQEEQGEGASEQGTDDEAGDDEASAPVLETVWFNGTTQGLGVPVAGHVCFASCENAFEFEVAEDVMAIVAELAWEADASLMFDVDIPYDECGTTMGDCPPESTSGDEGYLDIRVVETDVVSGNWTASVWADDSPAQPVEVTIAISLFAGEAPDGYTKLAQR